MKTFIIDWETNYGLEVMVINTFTKEGAEDIAKKKGAWDGYNITLLDAKKEGVVFYEGS
ncbi:MAG: hypothetical protein ACXAC7_22960 [Candidatus Hodarchaeales archaeon]|jgi:hypothetical protein